MSKFDYDVVFYRVFCITLLVTAFTFTVIITNVFIDIDGLLSNKEKYVPEISEFSNKLVNKVHEESRFKVTKDKVSNEDINYDSEINPSLRTKRSIETENAIYIKNPAMKKILTSRLANLLEELDKETKKEFLETTTVKEYKRVFEGTKESRHSIRNEDLLHLAMHNILLQGLLGHMDLNDVYKKVHILVDNFNKDIKSEDENDKKIKTLKNIINSNEISKDGQYNEEHKFFEEIVKCKKLEDQIARLKKIKDIHNTTYVIKRKKDNKVYIKAVIEIIDKNDTFGVNKEPKSMENIEGVVKLVYNGKSIKINQIEHQPKLMTINISNTGIVDQMSNNKNLIRENSQLKKVVVDVKGDKLSPNPLFDQVIEEYLKKHAFLNYSNISNGQKTESINTHRLKRQIKIRYFDDVTTSKTKLSNKTKTDDDDLYIEIETHFDGKGIKGEKKKNLVRNLIDKIQKALHSDIQEKRDNVEHIKFVKRLQDPIIDKNKATYLNTILPSLIPVEQRQLDPIDKTSKNHENIAHARGETWKKQVNGPNFLSASKSVNSAEMRELNIDYDRVLNNGMSKRLQKPLNTDTEEVETNNRILDENKGNVTLFLKNIDGTGFSIGFNQYVGEPPDIESMKMFTGVENLVREYHKSYDQEEISNESANDKLKNYVDDDHGVAKRNVENIHKIFRRSVKLTGTNNHRKKYKIFIQRNIPYKRFLNLNNHSNYKSILKFNNNQTKNINTIIRTKNFTREENLMLVDQGRKNKKTIKLLNLFASFNRSRRSLSIQKISSLKSKIKLNRYLNTKAMANKNIFIKNKRSKRQVNKIRILARDKSQTLRLTGSDENIFLISKENSYTDKVPIMSEVKTPDTNTDSKSKVHDDEDSAFSNIYQLQNGHLLPINSNEFHHDNTRSNILMSKYPHILVNQHTWSKEEEYVRDEKPYRINVKPYRIQPIPEQNDVLGDDELPTETSNTRELDPKVKEIVNAIIPRLSKTNYKVTLKISPKNRTNIDAGFKELHTTVNKSFEENGLRFVSLINVSQISKVEKLNRTYLEEEDYLDDRLKEQNNHLSTLLRLHKNKVDNQLNSLLKESKHLQKIIESNNGKIKFKNNTLFSGSINMPDLPYSEISNNDSGSVKNLIDVYASSTNFPVLNETLIKTTTRSEATTKLPNIDADKLKLLDTIKRNEKVTIEILNKIDSNTHILRSFLQKFSDRFEKNQAKNIPTIDETTKKPAIEVKFDLTKDWNVFDPKHNPFMVSNELRNDTIPFIYAYQQHIPIKNKKVTQGLASIIYHGHIHTTAVEAGKKNKFIKDSKFESNSKINADNGKIKFNETKFFMDDINHFKIFQNNTPVLTANININTTAT